MLRLTCLKQQAKTKPLPVTDLTDMFYKAYGSLTMPMVLCEGLEIIAFNSAFTHLVIDAEVEQPHEHSQPGQWLEGSLLNALIDDQNKIELLFSDIRVETLVELGSRSIAVSAKEWSYNHHFRLIEFQDQSHINELQSRLRIARSTDPSTGTLLPGAFQKHARSRLATTPHALLALLKISQKSSSINNLSDEAMSEMLMSTAETLRQELDGSTVIGRPNSSTLGIFTPLEGQSGEHQHVLRQIARVATQISPDALIKVGGSLFPENGSTIRDLYYQAQSALDARSLSKKPKMFDDELASSEARWGRLLHDLPSALKRNEVTPFFQPVIHSQTRVIKGFEALIRWFHPELGFVSPPDIIEIAKQLNLLHALTGHVIEQAVLQMAVWPPSVQFAINVTPTQLTGELIDLVRGIVRKASIDPGRLEIEVTEDALIADFKTSAQMFARLRAIGVSVAMDDFGAGYTSMSNLQTLDFNKIKIDKSISDGLPFDKKSIAIVKSLMFMAKELDVNVTVEGIETEEQLEFLRPFDCGVQGYVFAKPMPPKDLESMKRFLTPAVTCE